MRLEPIHTIKKNKRKIMSDIMTKTESANAVATTIHHEYP